MVTVRSRTALIIQCLKILYLFASLFINRMSNFHKIFITSKRRV